MKQTKNIEEWRPVRFYEGKYEVSNKGNIRSLKKGVLAKQRRINNGKEYVTLSGMHRIVFLGKKIRPIKGYEVGFLVASAFLADSHENERIVTHINEDVTDNRLENIKWLK